ncbi:Lsr2 family protein [Nocardia sp. XZ_19_385]|uniref:histone-like nucleoid-structuring protein Lsr2 n=1 Tax=Nocardia sp. XZ_19_385 TaxID=2769488 RepID=UPI00188E87D1|nr:Lsr2 family protein [Nocardia sp. XZ_19_385]
MARKVVVTLVDDYDGNSAAEETVSFVFDGVAYEMDLSTLNAKLLRGVFEQWIPYARKVGRAPRRTGSRKRSVVDRDQTAAIRAWGREQGRDVSRRGRISAGLAAAYAEANR